MPTPLPVSIAGWGVDVAAKLDLVWQLAAVSMVMGLCLVFLLAWVAVAVSFRR
jgi:cation transporter-like permease